MLQGHLQSQVSRRLFLRFLLAAMVPLGGFAWYAYSYVSQLLLDNQVQQLEQESKAYGMTLVEGLNSRADELKRLAEHFPDRTAIPVTTTSGFLSFGRLPANAVTGLSETQMSHLAQGRPLIRIAAGQPSVMFYLPPGQQDLLVGTIDPMALWQNDAASEHYCILNAQFSPLFCTPGLTPPKVDLWARQPNTGNTGFFPWQMNGTDYLVAYWHARLEAAYSDPGFIILVASNTEDALGGLSRFRQIFPALVILALALAAGLAFGQIRRQMKPLEQLTQGTQRLASGDFDTVIKEPGDDEFGNLAKAFNTMSGSLRNKFHMLNMLAALDRATLNASEMEYVAQAVLTHILRAIPCCGAAILRLGARGSGTMMMAQDETKNFESKTIEVKLSVQDIENMDLAQPWERLTISGSLPPYLEPFEAGSPTEIHFFPARNQDRVESVLILAFSGAPNDMDGVVQAGRNLADRLAVAASNIAWEEKLYHQAHYDALTDLPNRVLLRDRVEQALQRSERENTSVGAMLIDLDDFKQVNDSLGHSTGDALLVGCARRLEALARRSDTVARLGGDEFIFLIPDLARERASTALVDMAQKLIELLALPMTLAERQVSTSASIGIALYPDNADNFEDLLKMADAAMYDTKRRKSGNFSFYSEAMNETVRARFEMTQELHSAIENHEFVLYYQPKVDAFSQRIVGAEALVRWQSPNRGLVPPGQFLPLLNEIGLGEWLGEWVLNTACAQMKAWTDEGLPPLTVSVNIAPAQFMDGSILLLVQDTLTRHGLNPEQLELEILEETAIAASETVNETLTHLREMSINVALDDFGTGYSSLIYLTQIPANVLKIDRAFIRNLLTNPRQKTLLLHVIALAKVLDYKVVAEGVEEVSQLDALKEMGCDIIQGYLFSKPVPAETFAHLLGAGQLMPQAV